ncbi:MAG: 2-oxoglutarate and iron-dependent oxygenase domain-containing protein [Alphaproteobacteria bacterium]
MYVTNHGIGQRVLDDAIETACAFLHPPKEQKTKLAINKNNRGYNGLGRALMDGAEHPDNREFFQIGLDLPKDDPDVLAGQPLRGPNVWPEGQEVFRSALTKYYDKIGWVGGTVLRGVAVSLGLPPAFFTSRYAKPLHRTQVIY